MKKKYVYYCDDCKCFVSENHRCQQWRTVHMIPLEAIDQLLETAHNSDYEKCPHFATLPMLNEDTGKEEPLRITAIKRSKIDEE